MQVSMLEVDGVEVSDINDLREDVTTYYKNLFGKAEVADMHLDPNLWPANQQIQQDENEFLVRPFTMEELHLTIREMKNNTAPGPDGFSVELYKAFLPK